MERKRKIKKILIVFVFSVVAFLSSCAPTKQEIDGLEKHQKDIYQLAISVGYEGSFEDWLESIKGEQGEDGLDGQEIELIVEDSFIRWRYAGTTTWFNLISLEQLVGSKGDPGVDGREILLQVNDRYIQWQRVGDSEWKDLVALSTLVGAKGEDGREVEFQVYDGYIQWQRQGDTVWTNLIELSSLTGPKGEDGREVLFQVEEGYIKWKYAGDSVWAILIEITSLQGDQGLSAYQIYLIHFPYYEGSEEDWLNDLIDGKLGEKPTVSVTFESQGGTMPDEYNNIQEVIKGYTLELPLPTKDGFRFIGWYTGFSANDGHFTNSIPVSRNMTLYVRWAEEITFSFNTIGGSTIEDQIIIAGERSTRPNNPNKEDYVFIDWYVDEEYTTKFDFDSYISSATIIFAKWDPLLIVTFEVDGGDPIPSMKVERGSTIDLPIPVKDDNYFDRWVIIDDGSLITFTSNDHVEEDITLYAIWTDIGSILEFTLLANNTYSVSGYFDNEREHFEVPKYYNDILVTSIARNAFENSALKSIVISDSVTTLGRRAFKNTSLMYIAIPKSVTTIERWVFEGCSSLLEINVHLDNPQFSSINGVVFNKDQTTIVKYPIGRMQEEYTIPNGVVSIGIDAFYQGVYLKSVIIPNTVTEIGIWAFCVTGLESIIIPNSVTIIGGSAFSSNEDLHTVIIPNSVETIGVYAFSGCTSLTSIVIPISVTNIGLYAFNGCTSLIILCEAPSLPNGWHSDWNNSNRPVIWGIS